MKLSEEASNSFYRAMKCPVTAITGDKGFFTSDEAQSKIAGIGNLVEAFSRWWCLALTISTEGDIQTLADMLLGFSTGAIEPASDPIRHVS